MADYVFPSGVDGEGINVSHINYLYARAEDTLKTAIEITNLQYLDSVTDIDHDYMVVDAFTDSSGYNDTVCVADTTSTFCGTGLTGHYINTGPAETKVITNEVQYDNPIALAYIVDAVTGTGTVNYNIIDATTGNCIATAVPSGCFYSLTCCVCCHKYEINQCSDGISCVKSYALLAGEA